jgi:Rrf2 family iron-sulfur cluster assembly transcriptional regulator
MVKKPKKTANDYAKLAAIVEIARRSGEKPVRADDVASAIGSSASHIEVIGAELRKRGLVKGFVGPGGGYVLAKPPSRIFVADVVDFVKTGGIGKRYSVSDARAEENAQYLWEQSENLLLYVFRHISLANIIHGDLKANPFLKTLREFCRP